MNTRATLEKELLRYYVLKVLSEKESYCAQLHRDMKRYIKANQANLKVSYSKLNKVLHDLTEEGKLSSRTDEKDKKCVLYSVTSRGEVYMEAFEFELENKKKAYEEECKVVRFWPGFAMGIFFLLWFPLFAVAFWLVLAFVIAFCILSLAVPGAVAVAFAYFGVKTLIYAFTVCMGLGLAKVFLNLLFAVGLFIVCVFWLWLTKLFVKFAFRTSGKAFRRLFKFISVSGV